MKGFVTGIAACLAVLSAGPAAWGQVESHYLPAEWPRKLLPPYVSGQPKVDIEQLSAPLFHEMTEARTIRVETRQVDDILKTEDEAATDRGIPDATTLADMCRTPKKVVEQALRGEHEAAARAGRALLEKPKDTYGDFTWDYVASAVAWSWPAA